MFLYIITREAFPEGLAATNRIKCYAKAYLSQGVDCKVIVYGRHKYNDSIMPNGIAEGIPYEYIGGSVHRLNGYLKANAQSLYLYFKLLIFLFRFVYRGDVVLNYNEIPCLLNWVLLKVVHARKAFFISELCELPYGMGKETLMNIKQRKFTFNYLFPQYDGIIAISEALVEVSRKYCSASTIVLKVPILVNFDYYDIPDKSFSAVFPYIFHAGTLYEQKDGILGMIEAFGVAFGNMKNPIHFVLTGSLENSPHKNEIMAIIAKFGICNYIHFLGYVPMEELREYLAKASLVIINKYPTQQNKYCFSTKLGEYMAAGKPLIVTRVGEAMNWLTHRYDSIIVEPNNTTQLARAIVEFFENIPSSKYLGINAKKSSKQFFDYRNYSAKLTKMLYEISNNNTKN